MTRTGPPIAAVMRRLAETPGDFLGEPRLGNHGTVRLNALINDVLAPLGAGNDALILNFGPSQPASRRNACKLAMIAAWLLADEWLLAEPPSRDQLADFLLNAVPELAAQAKAETYVAEDDRREELVRTMFARLDFLPEGETEAQATDRLSKVSATERARLIAASRAAEARAREVREALARKKAQESADKWTRE